ncbi:hypothetical protein BDP27DRAFT_1439152 [Rhodocollybia butyracea]|uniref:Uncharacterized protein n=1 Tax=Rhodocollybia butyracea TaxID=206335 RepID=A0A9P5P2X2_9AGAR|nr:hypothetical protein BDP27DRAFT_1439152 [Rhodocollybia butyracea]
MYSAYTDPASMYSAHLNPASMYSAHPDPASMYSAHPDPASMYSAYPNPASMYSTHTDITTQHELICSSSSGSYRHQAYPSQNLSIHPRSTDYPAFLSTGQCPVLSGHQKLAHYLNPLPEFRHMLEKSPDVRCSTSTYASSSSRSIAATAHTQPPRPVPHPIFVPQTIVGRPQQSPERPVSFQAKGSSERGVQIFDLNIEDKRETPLRDLRDRMINVHIVWPGYKPFTGRINLRPQSGEATRIYILGEIGRIIEKFFKHPPPACHNDAPNWNLMRLNMDKVVITGLVHCGGANWQPELWYLGH